MRKLIAAINMTLDGFCDHTAIIPDDEIHRHYADLLRDAGVVLYGRITYELMTYWQTVLENPTGIEATDDFAVIMDKTPKVVFSRTLSDSDPVISGWETAKLAHRDLADEVRALKQQEGKDIYAGSPGMILALAQLDLLDEYQICVHPVIAGGGMPLFKNLTSSIDLKLLKTKTFSGGAILLYYVPKN